MSVSERSEALFLCPKFERYFGVFTGSEGLGDTHFWNRGNGRVWRGKKS